MSQPALPKVALSIDGGAIVPPASDIIIGNVHLGCGNEVSSFEALLFNFDEKYMTAPNKIERGMPIVVGIGRTPYTPTLLTGRIEELDFEDDPVVHLLWLRGRCEGRQLFDRVATIRYENQKGEAMVKDLIDTYTSLSHNRGGELIENTDTTYELVEHDDTPIKQIIDYIASTASKTGVIGMETRIEYDGKFAMFPKMTKTAPFSINELFEYSRYKETIARIRNWIRIRGAAEKTNPFIPDDWCESLTNWTTAAYMVLSLNADDPQVGSYSIQCRNEDVPKNYLWMQRTCSTFSAKTKSDYRTVKFWARPDSDATLAWIMVVILAPDISNCFYHYIPVTISGEWTQQELRIGFGGDFEFEDGSPDWENIQGVRVALSAEVNATYVQLRIDELHFTQKRWEYIAENTDSQTEYGRRDLSDIIDELHSDNACELRAKALLDWLEEYSQHFAIESDVIDYGNNHPMAGDKISPIPDYYVRINSIEINAVPEQILNMRLELGLEPSLLVDYVYKTRARADILMRSQVIR